MATPPGTRTQDYGITKHRLMEHGLDFLKERIEQREEEGGKRHLTDFPPVEDMIHMPFMTVESILRNLSLRYEKDDIYTNIGPSIMVAVNPYKKLPDLYSEEVLRSYDGHSHGQMPPHIFAVADLIYRNMRDTGGDQSVVVSGESGAGKTESCRFLIQYFISITGDTSKVERQLVRANHVLESFGNACTERNSNSSRFGKFTKIYFDDQGKITGSRITHYLLEKSRISHIGHYSRNFHIFYELTVGGKRGPEETQMKSIRGHEIGEPASYKYLNMSGIYEINEWEEGKRFIKTRNALDELDINGEKQEILFCVLLAILHLGEIEITAKGGNQDESEIVDETHIKIIADLLEVDEKNLSKSLVEKKIKSVGEVIFSPLSVEGARENQNALAKFLYSILFSWLIQQINQILDQVKGRTRIALLDIFGFESFEEVNRYEQFCINYANEKLQEFFNDHIFKLEEEVYRTEGLEWSPIKFVDNIEVLQLVESPRGFLDVLEEECHFPSSSEMSLRRKLNQSQGKSPHLQFPSKLRTGFTLAHYAGVVAYDLSDFIPKNKDNIQESLLDVVKYSGNIYIRKMHEADLLVSKEQDPSKTPARPPSPASSRPTPIHSPSPSSSSGKLGVPGRGFGTGRRGGGGKKTVSSQFRTQLQGLMDTLNETHAWFVRCVRPNPYKQPNNLHADMVTAQLRYSGMLETIRVRKSGYPIRIAHEKFVKQFHVCADGIIHLKREPQENSKKILHSAVPTTLRDLVQKRMEAEAGEGENPTEGEVGGGGKEHFQMGKSMVFMREEYYYFLEEARKHMAGFAAVLIQATWRGYVVKKWYLNYRKQVMIVQREALRWIYRRRFLRLKAATIFVQSLVRGKQQRERYLRILYIMTRMQGRVRGKQQRKRYLEYRNNVIICQSAARRKQALDRYAIMRKGFIRLQATAKMRIQRRNYLRALFLITRMQARVRGKQQRNKFLEYKKQVTICQSAVRRKQALDRFKTCIKGFIRLQATAKSRIERRKYLRKLWVITRMQARVRGKQQRNRFLSYKNKVIICQSAAKRRVALQRFAICMRGFIRLQATARMRKEKKEYIRVVGLITRMQARVKGKQQQKRYEEYKKKVIICQSAARRFLEMNRYRRCLQGFIRLQATVKMRKEREKYLETRATYRRCVSFVERWVLVRRLERQRKAAVEIQSWWRKLTCRRDFLTLRKKVILAQSLARRWLTLQRVKKEKEMIIKCQSYVRTWGARRKYLKMKSSIPLMQAVVRGHIARKRYQNERRLIILLQACTRRHCQQKKYKKQQELIILTQARGKGLVAYNRFWRMKKATIRIQRAVRIFLSKNKDKREERAATLIQSRWRGFVERREYLKQRKAAITIQKTVRGWILQRRHATIVNGVVALQRMWREYMHHKKARAATKIQATYRGYHCRKMIKKVKAAILIQSIWRMALAKRALGKLYRESGRYRNIIICQSAVRRWLARKIYLKKLKKKQEKDEMDKKTHTMENRVGMLQRAVKAMEEEKMREETNLRNQLKQLKEQMERIEKEKEEAEKREKEMERRNNELRESEGVMRRENMELRGKYDTLQRSNEKETRGQGAVLLLKNTEIETLKKDLEKSIRGGEERGERWREKIDGMEKRYEGEIQGLHTLVARCKMEVSSTRETLEKERNQAAEERKERQQQQEEEEDKYKSLHLSHQLLTEQMEGMKNSWEERWESEQREREKEREAMERELERVREERDVLREREKEMEMERSVEVGEWEGSMKAVQAVLEVYKEEAGRLREQIDREREIWGVEREGEERRREGRLEELTRELVKEREGRLVAESEREGYEREMEGKVRRLEGELGEKEGEVEGLRKKVEEMKEEIGRREGELERELEGAEGRFHQEVKRLERELAEEKRARGEAERELGEESVLRGREAREREAREKAISAHLLAVEAFREGEVGRVKQEKEKTLAELEEVQTRYDSRLEKREKEGERGRVMVKERAERAEEKEKEVRKVLEEEKTRAREKEKEDAAALVVVKGESEAMRDRLDRMKGALVKKKVQGAARERRWAERGEEQIRGYEKMYERVVKEKEEVWEELRKVEIQAMEERLRLEKEVVVLTGERDALKGELERRKEEWEREERALKAVQQEEREGWQRETKELKGEVVRWKEVGEKGKREGEKAQEEGAKKVREVKGELAARERENGLLAEEVKRLREEVDTLEKQLEEDVYGEDDDDEEEEKGGGRMMDRLYYAEKKNLELMERNCELEKLLRKEVGEGGEGGGEGGEERKGGEEKKKEKRQREREDERVTERVRDERRREKREKEREEKEFEREREREREKKKEEESEEMLRDFRKELEEEEEETEEEKRKKTETRKLAEELSQGSHQKKEKEKAERRQALLALRSLRKRKKNKKSKETRELELEKGEKESKRREIEKERKEKKKEKEKEKVKDMVVSLTSRDVVTAGTAIGGVIVLLFLRALIFGF